MFGSSNSFGQSSSAPFGSQSPFGQNNATNNPFAPKPFGAPNPFGSPTGGSVFGNTSTGVFGQSSSPLSSTPTFGAASSSGFGNTTPAFGSQSSSFGGSSTFGGFGSGAQPSPFGSSFQQSQPAFSNNLFGSNAPFGASSQPSAFGSSTTPTFGSTSTAAFGAPTTQAFGSTPSPTFGSTGSAFGVGSTAAFGSGGAFGSSNTSVFGTGSAPAFGAATSSAFGTTSAFGQSSSPFGASSNAFGASSNAFAASSNAPAFGGSSTPTFGFNSSSAFGQTASPFGNSVFGSTSPFGSQTASVQTTTPTFGSGAFGQSNQGGSRIAPFQATPDTDGSSNQPAGKLESISAMQVYKDKSHEELRWEDYQRGDKGGGTNAAGQSTTGPGFGVSGAVSNPFGSSPTLGQSTANPFQTSSTSPQNNIFAPKPSPFGGTGLGTSTPTFGSSPFGSAPASTPSLFGSSPAQTPGFGMSTSAFSSSPSIFGSAITSATTSPSIFGATPSQGQFGTSVFGSQPSPLFQSTSPSLGMGSSGSLFGQSTSFPNTFNTASSFSTGGLSFATGGQPAFNLSTSSFGSPFQQNLPAQQNNAFSFNNAGQSQAGGASGIFGQSSGQLGAANQSPAVLQPVAVTNPFGTLPAMPHMSIGNTGTSPSIQYGISSMPVVDKPTPVRVTSLLTSRHLSQRRIRLPARKYHPKNDDSRVAFFSEEDEAPSTPKADALFIPRENPRSLIIRPIEQWPKSSMKEPSAVDLLVYENGKGTVENQHHLNGSVEGGNSSIANGNGSVKDQNHSVKFSQRPTSCSDDTPNQKGDSYITLSGHRAGEAAIVYEHGADIEATMPKLRHSDYYTEPRIQELAAKERAEPGFCRHVKDFVVGRHNYGSIKFLGETDVRRLDLESLIQFNNREVIVYMDDSKKPPVGQGLNKPAEVTLLNIKCYDKNKNQIIEGPKVEKYKQMLKKKAEDQGAEFLSYDPSKGEWKFRVEHFSKYVLNDDDQWDTD